MALRVTSEEDSLQNPAFRTSRPDLVDPNKTANISNLLKKKQQHDPPVHLSMRAVQLMRGPRWLVLAPIYLRNVGMNQ